eukprot:4922617-Prymnesium_polylepis.2
MRTVPSTSFRGSGIVDILRHLFHYTDFAVVSVTAADQKTGCTTSVSSGGSSCAEDFVSEALSYGMIARDLHFGRRGVSELYIEVQLERGGVRQLHAEQ